MQVRGDAARYGAGRTTAVIGSGYSAITVLRDLVDVGGSVEWITRREAGAAPYQRIEGDPLPQRDALAAFGNELASGSAAQVTYRGGSVIGSVRRDPASSKYEVSLASTLPLLAISGILTDCL